ncbi:MAG: hypothetical protein ACREBW_09590, partial [Candidatus Micrarchaeaceae archaeon]
MYNLFDYYVLDPVLGESPKRLTRERVLKRSGLRLSASKDVPFDKKAIVCKFRELISHDAVTQLNWNTRASLALVAKRIERIRRQIEGEGSTPML